MLFSFCCSQLIMSKFVDEILEDIRKKEEKREELALKIHILKVRLAEVRNGS